MSDAAHLAIGEGTRHDPAGAGTVTAQTRPLKILLVDDDELFLEFAATMLRAAGHEAETSASAAEAIAALDLYDDRKPPRDFDAVLIDIVMPEVSGTELCSLIRGHAGYRTLPVIMISATRDMSLIDQALTAGGSSYIQKPIQAATFAEEIRRKIEDAQG